MRAPARKPAETEFVETPNGLFTAGGVWFHTTAAALEEYAGALLRRVPLARLLYLAETWLRAPDTLLLWLLPPLLLLLPPLPAALVALGVYVASTLLGPVLVSPALARLAAALSRVWLQGLYYVGMLSVLAYRGAYPAVWVGLAGFMLVRWGLLERAFGPLARRLQRSWFPLPPADQILRGMIVRLALRHGVSLPEVDRMERRMLELLRRRP